MNDIVAENYLCFPALLSMVIDDAIGIRISQFEIAEYLGIVVPQGYKEIINNQIESVSSLEFGTQINTEIVQNFLDKNNINLKIHYFKINEIRDMFFSDFIRRHLNNKEYLICSYSYGLLFENSCFYELGHVSLITEVDVNGRILIYDPGPKDYGSKYVDDLHLYDAIQYRHGGVYTFSKL